MANEEQLALLTTGVEMWNKWREEEPDAQVDLTKADLSEANLEEAYLSEANLEEAFLFKAKLKHAYLIGANLTKAKFWAADLQEAYLCGAYLIGANPAYISGANLEEADLTDANLSRAYLIGANLKQARLHQASLRGTDLSGANLNGANLWEADLRQANLSRAKFIGASLRDAYLSQANLRKANLWKAYLPGADLSGADLSGANLREADLSGANLSGANLRRVDLRGADLSGTTLIQARVSGANISRCKIYGVNVWDLEGEFKEQKDLTITPTLNFLKVPSFRNSNANISVNEMYQPRVRPTPSFTASGGGLNPKGNKSNSVNLWRPQDALKQNSSITVDNIKVAQFVYLILNNKEIRDVINTLTSKTVLILGRFAIPQRKAILDALKNKLREYNLLPIVFDFDRPTDKDFTETIKTLASISYFVIADVTNPKSSPLELQATIPDYQIPFVPIIQEGEYPFAMMIDLQKKYNWVLDTISYDSLDTLIQILKPHIIDPAIKKRDELRLIKAKEPTIISGRKLLSKK